MLKELNRDNKCDVYSCLLATLISLCINFSHQFWLHACVEMLSFYNSSLSIKTPACFSEAVSDLFGSPSVVPWWELSVCLALDHWMWLIGWMTCS